MKVIRTLSEWANKHFFVKESKPRIIIGLASVSIGLAADILLDAYRRMEKVPDQYLWLTGAPARFIAGLGICVIVAFSASGIYNCWRRRSNRSEGLDSTRTTSKTESNLRTKT